MAPRSWAGGLASLALERSHHRQTKRRAHPQPHGGHTRNEDEE
jgi:hypothetical protein